MADPQGAGSAHRSDDRIRRPGGPQRATASATNRQLVLFGGRDVALAYEVVSIGDSQCTHWLRIEIACDLADAVAGILAGREGELPRIRRSCSPARRCR